MYGEQEVIRSTPKKRILKDLYTDHYGRARMKDSMSNNVFGRIWTKKIEEHVKSFICCVIAAKESLIKFTPWI